MLENIYELYFLSRVNTQNFEKLQRWSEDLFLLHPIDEIRYTMISTLLRAIFFKGVITWRHEMKEKCCRTYTFDVIFTFWDNRAFVTIVAPVWGNA